MRLGWYLLLSSIVTECGGSKKSAASEKASVMSPDLYVRIERTPCYGRCPIDVVEAFADGKVRYEGKRFVPRLGIYQRQLSSKELDTLRRLLVEAKFGQYADVYDNPGITDLPSLELKYRLDGQEKSITCRTGCPPELPDKIERLRTFLADQGSFQMEKGPEEETISDPSSDD